MHGGIYCAVAETVASIATVNAVWKDGYVGSGLNNYASFLRPITGGTVDVTAKLRGHDEREWTWGHEFRDEAEKLCALVEVTIAVRPAPPGLARRRDHFRARGVRVQADDFAGAGLEAPPLVQVALVGDLAGVEARRLGEQQ